MDRRGRAVAAVVLGVLLLAAGAIFLDTNGDVGEADLEERYRAVDDYTGTMRIETVVVGPTENTTFSVRNGDGESVPNDSVSSDDPRLQGSPTVVADVLYRRPGTYRYDYREPPDPDLVTVVLDGTEARLYQRGGEVTETRTSRLGIETIGIRIADVARNFSDRYEVSRVDEATVAGRDARVLDLTASVDVERPIDRLWIDEETNLPIRATLASGGRNSTITVTYTNMSYDAGLPEDAFAVDVTALPEPGPSTDGPGGTGGGGDGTVDDGSFTANDTHDGALGNADETDER